MRSVSLRLVDLERKPLIPLGFEGENEYTTVRVDCKKIFDEHPDAVPTLAVTPPEGDSYPAVVVRDGDIVSWTVTDSDLVHSGTGEIQFAFVIDDTIIGKTYKARTKVLDSILPSGEAPTPIQNWLIQAAAALQALPTEVASAVAALMGAMVGVGETLDPDDDVTVNYDPVHNTLTIGVPHGRDGEDGHTPAITAEKVGKVTTFYVDGVAKATISDGQDADPTALIDDASTAQNRTWSAKKLDEENRSLKTQINSAEDSIQSLEDTIYGTPNYIPNKNFDRTNYTEIDDDTSCFTDYFPVTHGIPYRFDCGVAQNLYAVVFYDSNHEYTHWYGLNGGGTQIIKRTISASQIYETDAYFRFSFNKELGGIIEAAYGSTYTVIYKSDRLDGIDDRLDGIDDRLDGIDDRLDGITPQMTTFFHVSSNLINPNAYVDGEYVNWVTGAFSTNANYHRTDYIPVIPGKTYCLRSSLSNAVQYCFYSESKVKSTAENLSNIINGVLITAGENDRYIAISTRNKSATIGLAESDSIVDIEPYSNTYILPEYIIEEIPDSTPINLPSKIYALVGYELNIYFENLVEKWEDFDWDVACSKGKQYERGFKIVPTEADVGSYSITIQATNKKGYTSVATAQLVIASASAGTGASASVIILGDSTTYNSIAVTKLNENFSADVMSITTRGTMGTAPNNHEGRSGWKLDDYFTKEYIVYPPTDPRGTIYNPFYNPNTQTFDASYYFTNSGIVAPEWFVINMGINDMFSYATDASLETAIQKGIDYLDYMITSLKSAVSGIKVCICCTIPPNHSQDAFGKAYSCGQTRNRYKRNNYLWVKRLIDEYDERENENVYMIPIHVNLDTVYNMGMETLPVNARNTDITYQSPISNGGVHPVTSGYWQIADVYTAFLKAQTNT